MLTQEAAELLAGMATEVINADEILLNNDLPFPDYGQLSSVSWKSFLFRFKSAKIYIARIEDFFLYLRLNGKEGIVDQQALEEALVEYFDYNHQLVDEDGNPKFKGSQFRGWFSMFIISNEQNISKVPLTPFCSHTTPPLSVVDASVSDS